MNSNVINLKDAKRMALASANEDYTGLYELVWELNTRYPSSGIGAKYTIAESTVRELINQGLIALYHRRLAENDEVHEPINGEAVDSTLSDPVKWYPEDKGGRVVFSATEEGEKAYMSDTEAYV